MKLEKLPQWKQMGDSLEIVTPIQLWEKQCEIIDTLNSLQEKEVRINGYVEKMDDGSVKIHEKKEIFGFPIKTQDDLQGKIYMCAKVDGLHKAPCKECVEVSPEDTSKKQEKTDVSDTTCQVGLSEEINVEKLLSEYVDAILRVGKYNSLEKAKERAKEIVETLKNAIKQ